MRLKLIIENFKHYWVSSLFIIIMSIVITTFSLLCLEFNGYLTHVGIEENLYANHEFDIVISSQTPLSINGVKGYYEIGEYISIEDYYKRNASFYSSTLIVKGNEGQTLCNIIEGDSEDYVTAFDLDVIPKDNEVVITSELAAELDLSENDLLSVIFGGNEHIYKIVDVINSKGKYGGVSALIGGRKLTYYYGLDNVKMANLIMLDLENSENAEYVCSLLEKNYGDYNIENVLDSKKVEGFTSRALQGIIVITVSIFIIILMSLVNIYTIKIKKQKEIFMNFGKKDYFLQVHIIEWGILYFISVIFGGAITNLFFTFFYSVFNCDTIYVIKLYNYLIAGLFIFITPIIIIVLSKINLKNNVIKYVLCGVVLTLIILMLFIKNKSYISAIIIVLSIVGLTVVVKFLIHLTKYFKNFLSRIYLYDINKGNTISRLLVVVQICIYTILVILVSNIFTYTKQINEFDTIIKPKQVLVTNTRVELNDKYEEVKVASNLTLDDMNLFFVLALDGEQLGQLSNVYLTESEKEEYNSKKHIILSKHYRNINGFEIGDEISLDINGYEEKFIVYRFLETSFIKMAYVSNSDVMSYGYVLDGKMEGNVIIEDFGVAKYKLLSIDSFINQTKNIFEKTLNLSKYVLISLILIIILYSIYLFYLDFQYQNKIITIIKKLGCSNKSWLKLTLCKSCLSLLLCLSLGFVFNFIVQINYENAMTLLNAVSYINFDFVLAITCLPVLLINNLLGVFYSNYVYRKIKI